MADSEFVGRQSPDIEFRAGALRCEQFVHGATDPRQLDMNMATGGHLPLELAVFVDAETLCKYPLCLFDIGGGVGDLEMLGAQQPGSGIESGVWSLHGSVKPRGERG